MAFDLKKLKKNRGTSLKELQRKAEEERSGGGSFAPDARIYKPKMNKKGSNTVTLRFLPPQNGGDVVVEYRTMQFRGKGGNYWEKSLVTKKNEDGTYQKDPCVQARINGYMRNKSDPGQGFDKTASQFSEQKKYVANVLVLKDAEQPEMVGKVMIYEFGPRIKGMIDNAVAPKHDDIDPIDPFDLWTGHDFTVRMSPKIMPDGATVPEYDDSSFASRESELGDSDEDKEAFMLQTHDLDEYAETCRPGPYKTFDELAALFEKKYGKPYNWLSADFVDTRGAEIAEDEPASAPAPKTKSAPAPESTPPWDNDEDEDAADADDEPEDDDDETDSDDEAETPTPTKSETNQERFKRIMRENAEKAGK